MESLKIGPPFFSLKKKNKHFTPISAPPLQKPQQLNEEMKGKNKEIQIALTHSYHFREDTRTYTSPSL